jgi:hypothetical protein
MKLRTILKLLLPVAALWLVFYVGNLLPPFTNPETKKIEWFAIPCIATDIFVIVCAVAPIVRHINRATDSVYL